MSYVPGDDLATIGSGPSVPDPSTADEVIDILENQPDVREIQVENVKFLRYSEVSGNYDHAVAVLNSADPHST